MPKKAKYDIKKEFGAYLKKHRLEVLKETNLLAFSYNSNLDNSKLGKIEKGEVDFQFETLLELAKTYKLTSKDILGFKFETGE
jgi:predicted transcriptional regulator